LVWYILCENIHICVNSSWFFKYFTLTGLCNHISFSCMNIMNQQHQSWTVPFLSYYVLIYCQWMKTWRWL